MFASEYWQQTFIIAVIVLGDKILIIIESMKPIIKELLVSHSLYLLEFVNELLQICDTEMQLI